MRIAQISTLSAPVREDSSGSVESWTWLLTRELVRLGHEVTVFGSADSKVPGRLVQTQPGVYGDNGGIDDWHVCEWVNICRAVEMAREFDVLHSHAYLWGVPLSPLSAVPMIHTTHIVPDENSAKLWTAYPQAHVTALSHRQWSEYPNLKPAAVIHHGVEVSRFTFNAQPGDYLCYLGRFVSGKGPRQAIAIARSVGMRLLMAGPPSQYFREHVQPLVDGRTVEYVGFVKGLERDQLLGGARALLYPIQFPESFGLVLLESMLCGTPIAATRLGAVPELVDEGITGATAASMEEMPDAVRRCLAMDRRKVRQWAEERFSIQVMAKQYERLYERIAASQPA
jgi:glycosyltransferase involved in cell wall biosynthesis